MSYRCRDDDYVKIPIFFAWEAGVLGKFAARREGRGPPPERQSDAPGRGGPCRASSSPGRAGRAWSARRGGGANSRRCHVALLCLPAARPAARCAYAYAPPPHAARVAAQEVSYTPLSPSSGAGSAAAAAAAVAAAVAAAAALGNHTPRSFRALVGPPVRLHTSIPFPRTQKHHAGPHQAPIARPLPRPASYPVALRPGGVESGRRTLLFALKSSSGPPVSAKAASAPWDSEPSTA